MKMKRYWTRLTALIGMGLIGAVTIAVWAEQNEVEEKISLDQTPAAVKATILKEAAGGTIKEIERETKNGKTIYEAEVIIGGKEVEIKVAPDGTLLGKECEDDEENVQISLDKVPQAARKALLKLAGKAKITEVEQQKKHGAVLYEAEWKVNGQEREATVTAEGALVKLEEEIAAKDVPGAVKRAAAKIFPDTADLEFEKKTVIMYEVEGKINGKKHERLIWPTGKVKVTRHKKQGHRND